MSERSEPPEFETPPLFEILRAALGPRLAELGFSASLPAPPLRNLLLAWSRPEGEGWLQLVVHRDPRGLFPERLGRRFGVELRRAPTPSLQRPSRAEALWFLLDDSGRSAWRALHEEVLEELPARAGAGLVANDSNAWCAEELERLARPFVPNQDPGLRYRTAAELEAWALLLGRLLPAAIERF